MYTKFLSWFSLPFFILFGFTNVSAQSVSSVRFEIDTNLAQYPIPGLNDSGNRRIAAKIYYSNSALALNTLPVVLFSSGWGDETKNYESLVVDGKLENYGLFSRLAKRGYVVIAVEHPHLDWEVPLSALGTIRRSDTYFYTFALNRSKYSAREAQWRATDISCFIDLFRDDKKVGDFRDSAAACEPSIGGENDEQRQVLQERFNAIFLTEDNAFKPTKIGIIGHSFGGLTAQAMVSDSAFLDTDEAIQQPLLAKALASPIFDSRVDAGINFDGPSRHNYAQTGKIKRPFIYVAAEEFWAKGNKNEDGYRLMRSRVACRSDGYAIKINDSKHYTPFRSTPATILGKAVKFVRRHQSVALAHTDLHFSKYLKGDVQRSLLDDPNYFQALDGQSEKLSWQFDESDFITYFDGRNEECDMLDLSNDSDKDGVSDGDEMYILATNPLAQDEDGDSIVLGLEFLTRNEVLMSKNSDGDKAVDVVEEAIGTYPGWPDSDGDGVCDDTEFLIDNTKPKDSSDFNVFRALVSYCDK